MKPSHGLAPLILTKLHEQVERTEHLLAQIPASRMDWQPAWPTPEPSSGMPLGRLLGHLLSCLAGFCAALYAAHSDRLAHFNRLRELPVNHHCGVDEARQRLRHYMVHIEEGMALVTDADLARRIPTVFVPQGEALLTLLLGNLEHFTNHKYQLFFYLKMLGIPLSTRDLYVWRGR
jgi:DinB superfamily